MLYFLEVSAMSVNSTVQYYGFPSLPELSSALGRKIHWNHLYYV